MYNVFELRAVCKWKYSISRKSIPFHFFALLLSVLGLLFSFSLSLFLVFIMFGIEYGNALIL